MNDTIAGLWRAVDEGWQNEIDHHLFALLTDAYLDAGDEVSAQGLEWCMKHSLRPHKETQGGHHAYLKCWWYIGAKDDWIEFNYLKPDRYQNYLPVEFANVAGYRKFLHYTNHNTVSEAYFSLLKAWDMLSEYYRDVLLNLPVTKKVDALQKA